MKFKYPVINEWETVQYIIDHGVGIARIGDGEWKLACGKKIKSQLAHPGIQKRMIEVMGGDNPKCIVGIPRIFEGIPSTPGTKAHHFWTTMEARKDFARFYNPNKQYFSSFISRFDAVPEINSWEYIDHIKKIWEGKDVVIVRGDKIDFCKHPSLTNNCNILGEVIGPNVNAWDSYDKILGDCMRYPEDTTFLIRLGPSASVLSWDLGMHGRQGVDCGHLGMFVRRYIEKDPTLPEPEYINYGTPSHLKDAGNK